MPSRNVAAVLVLHVAGSAACASGSAEALEAMTPADYPSGADAEATSVPASTDLFSDYQIAAAEVQLEEHNVKQYEYEHYVEKVHRCDGEFSRTVGEWVAEQNLAVSSESEPDGGAGGRVIVVDVASPTEGFLFVAYRRFDEGRRASLRLRFDSPQQLAASERNNLIQVLQLNALRQKLTNAIGCTGR